MTGWHELNSQHRVGGLNDLCVWMFQISVEETVSTVSGSFVLDFLCANLRITHLAPTHLGRLPPVLTNQHVV
jgi:hypothetical protein